MALARRGAHVIPAGGATVRGRLPAAPRAATARAGAPALPRHAAEGRIHALTRWTFYLFVASIPFEYPDRSIPLEVTTLTAAVFLLATLRQPVVCYRQAPRAALWFLGYLVAYALAFVFGDGTYPHEAGRLWLTLLELVLVFWAGFNLLRREPVARAVLWALVVATCVRALLQFAGADSVVRAAGRASALGQNANLSALNMSVGLLALIGLAFARANRPRVPRLLIWAVAAVLGFAIVQTGSRGGLLAFGLGLLTLAVGAGTAMNRIRNTAVVLGMLAMLGWMTMRSPVMVARIEAGESGNLAGREAIFPTAWQMFLERPWIGWGPAANKYELGARLPWQERPRRDTHNLLLELFTGTGLVGAVPFLVGTALCVAGAWRARRGTEGALPLAIMATALSANMSGNFIVAEVFWLGLAYAVAGGAGRAVAVPSARWRSRSTEARYTPERIGAGG